MIRDSRFKVPVGVNPLSFWKPSIAELDREIENLLFETRVRREVVSTTAGVLLQHAAARRRASLTTPQRPTHDPRPVVHGRVP